MPILVDQGTIYTVPLEFACQNCDQVRLTRRMSVENIADQYRADPLNDGYSSGVVTPRQVCEPVNARGGEPA